MPCDEGCRTAVFGKTERTVGWEGNGEPVMMGLVRHCIWGNPQRTDRPNLSPLSHSFTLDFVCAFQYRGEAERFYKALPERLQEFGLQVAPEKTKIHRFSRFHPSRESRFTFLGFEFYWEADTQGVARVWRRTSRKKLQSGIQACKEWLKANRNLRLPELLMTMKRKVRGHFNYFRAIGNIASLWTFHKAVTELLYKWLNRRSQRRSLTWEQLNRLLKAVMFPTPKEVMQALRNRGIA